MRFFGFVFVVVSCCLLYCFSFVFAGGLLLLCHVVHDHVDDIILYDILYDLVFFCFFFFPHDVVSGCFLLFVLACL